MLVLAGACSPSWLGPKAGSRAHARTRACAHQAAIGPSAPSTWVLGRAPMGHSHPVGCLREACAHMVHAGAPRWGLVGCVSPQGAPCLVFKAFEPSFGWFWMPLSFPLFSPFFLLFLRGLLGLFFQPLSQYPSF